MADPSESEAMLAKAEIVHCDFKRSQQGPGGFDLTGSVHLNRGRIEFPDGYNLDFHLAKCEIKIDCLNCTFDSGSIAFQVHNKEFRIYTYTQENEVNEKTKNSSTISGGLSGQIADDGNKGNINAKADKSRSRELTDDEKLRRTMAAEDRICRYTTAISCSSDSVTWELCPDDFASKKESSAPKGTLLGVYMANGDRSLASVRFPDRPLDQPDHETRGLRVAASFQPAHIIFLPLEKRKDWHPMTWVANLREPSLRSLVARLKLGKIARRSLEITEI